MENWDISPLGLIKKYGKRKIVSNIKDAITAAILAIIFTYLPFDRLFAGLITSILWKFLAFIFIYLLITRSSWYNNI